MQGGGVEITDRMYELVVAALSKLTDTELLAGVLSRSASYSGKSGRNENIR
ncbi:hypothetical protein BH09VER1_BH09VER1_46050 [soil metagenome]